MVQEFPLSLPLSRYRRPEKDSRVREACIPEWLRTTPSSSLPIPRGLRNKTSKCQVPEVWRAVYYSN